MIRGSILDSPESRDWCHLTHIYHPSADIWTPMQLVSSANKLN